MQIRIGDRLYELRSQADLEAICAELRSALEPKCTYKSWYIRVPPERILEILVDAYTSYLKGEADVGAVVGRHLERLGLNKSLARTITPTLSALGLSTGGVFSRQALEVGRLLYEGRRQEALSLLRDAALKNCVVTDIIQRLDDECRELPQTVEAVLRSYGKSPRYDEMKYTAEFIKLIDGRCAPCDLNCVDKAALAGCSNLVVERVIYGIVDLFEKLDISVLPMHLALVKARDGIYEVVVRETNKLVGLVALAEPIEGAQVGKLRDVSRSLDGLAGEGEYEFYIKIVPILEGQPPCYKAKAFVEVVRADLEKASRIIKLEA
ncbi:MAG: hypothetical protein ABWJ97_03560, partial [Thermoproteus sp.]